MTCSIKIKKNLNFLFLRHVDPFVRMLHIYDIIYYILVYIILGGSAGSGTRLSLFLSPRRFRSKFFLLHKYIGAKIVNI